MSNIPLRNPDPPIKWANIPVCPECKCEELGVIYLEKSFKRVLSWWDKGSPDETEVEEIEHVKDLGYYCCYCGEEFTHPEFIKMEVY